MRSSSDREVRVRGARDLGLCERLVGEVGERLAAPERERRLEQLARTRRVAVAEPVAGLRGELLEALQIDGLGPRSEHVAARCASPARRGRAPCAGARCSPGGSWRPSPAGARPRARRSGARWGRPRAGAGAGSRAAFAAAARRGAAVRPSLTTSSGPNMRKSSILLGLRTNVPARPAARQPCRGARWAGTSTYWGDVMSASSRGIEWRRRPATATCRRSRQVRARARPRRRSPRRPSRSRRERTR